MISSIIMSSKDNPNYSLNISLRLSFSGLSLIGSTIIILSYLKFIRLRKFAFKLIFLLSISDLIFSISNFLIFEDADQKPAAFCKIQAFFLYFSSISSVFWTSIIAYSLHHIVTHSSTRKVQKKIQLFCVVGYGIPFCLSILPFFWSKYGPRSFVTDASNSWCGIMRDDNIFDKNATIIDSVVRLGPVFCCFIFNVYKYWKVHVHFKQYNSKTELMDTIDKKIKFFPILPILCWLIEIVFRILEVSTNIFVYKDQQKYDDDLKWLYTLEAIDMVLINSHGLLNFLLYGMTRYVMREWKKLLSKKKEEDFFTPGNSTNNRKDSWSSCNSEDKGRNDLGSILLRKNEDKLDADSSL